MQTRTARTRTAVTFAALELVLERGFDATTVSDIAERAGVSRRTVLTRFATKEEIVLGPVGDDLDRLEQRLRDGAGDVLDRFLQWVDAEGQATLADPLEHLRQRAIVGDPQLRALELPRLEATGAAVARAAAAGAGLREDHPAAQAFGAAVLGLMLAMRRQFVEPPPGGEGDGFEEGVRVLRAALSALGSR